MTTSDEQALTQLIALAKQEDLGGGDLSASLLPNPTEPATFRLIAKEPGVFAGQTVIPAVLDAYGSGIEIEWTPAGRDGGVMSETPVDVALLRGPLGSLLTAERVVLNFLQRLCGVATQTRQHVDAVQGTDAVILDTRKTTPGWRWLEKYAVRCGGGENHRFGLYDAVLIKDNHLAGVEPGRLAPAVFEMLNQLAASKMQPSFVEVEVDTLEQVEQLLAVIGIDAILLDNFSLDDLRRAVERRDALSLRGKLALEASGGVTLDTVREVAETGVDRISIGALTHSAVALDLSMERA